MATSKVSICSSALLMLGQEPIADFNEATTAARLCSNLWEDAKNGVLRSHPWNCATKRILLAPLSEGPAFGYTKQFQRPADWLRTLWVGDQENGEQFDWQIEGDRILADVTSLPLRYIRREDDISIWDALLIEAMIHYMAFKLAYPITKSASQQASMGDLYQFSLKQARTINGQEDTPEDMGDSPLLQSRFR